MGTQWLDQTRYADGVPMTVRNKSDHIAFLDLKTPGQLERATTIVVLPGEAIQFPIAGNGVGKLWSV